MKLVKEHIEFERGVEPRKAMRIGYGNKMKTKAWKILEFIRSKGEEGASTKEIQEYIYFDLNKANLGKDWFYKKDSQYNQRVSRGYWNSAFYKYDDSMWGGKLKKRGLLSGYCHKNKKGKWVLDRMPEQGANIVHESIEFERGIEPSKAMNMGIHRKIRTGDKFLAVYQYDDHLRDYHLIKGIKEVVATENETEFDEIRTVVVKIKELPGYTWFTEFREGKWVIP